MDEGSRTVLALVVLSWGSLAVLVAVFLRLALRSDGGFGGVGQFLRRRRAMPPRIGVTPVALPPRHVVRSHPSRP
jgi:hypothetical protein